MWQNLLHPHRPGLLWVGKHFRAPASPPRLQTQGLFRNVLENGTLPQPCEPCSILTRLQSRRVNNQRQLLQQQHRNVNTERLSKSDPQAWIGPSPDLPLPALPKSQHFPLLAEGIFQPLLPSCYKHRPVKDTAVECATAHQNPASLLKDTQGSFKVRAAQDVLSLLAWTHSQSDLWSGSKKAFKLLETAGLAPPSGSSAPGAAGAASARAHRELILIPIPWDPQHSSIPLPGILSPSPSPRSSAQQHPQSQDAQLIPIPRILSLSLSLESPAQQ